MPYFTSSHGRHIKAILSSVHPAVSTQEPEQSSLKLNANDTRPSNFLYQGRKGVQCFIDYKQCCILNCKSDGHLISEGGKDINRKVEFLSSCSRNNALESIICFHFLKLMQNPIKLSVNQVFRKS